MFSYNHMLYNQDVEDMKKLIQVLEKGQTIKIERKSISFMKMLVCVISIADVSLKVSGY